MRATRIAAAGLAVCALGAAPGCAAGGTSADDPVIWHEWREDDPAMLALLTTELVLKDGCLQGEDGLIAFPRAYGEWDAESQMLIFGDSTFSVGDTIEAGGGGGSITEDMTIPSGCSAAVGDPVFFVQSTSLD